MTAGLLDITGLALLAPTGMATVTDEPAPVSADSVYAPDVTPSGHHHQLSSSRQASSVNPLESAIAALTRSVSDASVPPAVDAGPPPPPTCP